MHMLLSIHVVAAGLAIVLGFTALCVHKGGTAHRRSGLLFVYAMILMGTSASIVAFRKSPSDPNVIAGIAPLYFVVTALTTVRPVSSSTRRINVAALGVPVSLVLYSASLGVIALNSPTRGANGVPSVMHFFLAALMGMAAVGDVRFMRNGMPRGGPRLARHLWRMCFALFIAAGSFFAIRERVAKILPEPFTIGPMRALPILLLFGAMFYWLWRIRARRRLPVLVRYESAPTSASRD